MSAFLCPYMLLISLATFLKEKKYTYEHSKLRVHVPLHFNHLTDVHKTWHKRYQTLRHHFIILSIPIIHYNKRWTRTLDVRHQVS
jgi:hypothetical protein